VHGEHHDLIHEFPEYRDQIHALKVSDPYFRKLFDEYHGLDRDIRRAEANIEPTTDEHAEEMKLRRLQLKDELFELLQAA
jgi:uncharacterized protein YdcH (DUF465 family)